VSSSDDDTGERPCSYDGPLDSGPAPDGVVARSAQQQALFEEAQHVIRPCGEEIVGRYWRFFAGGLLHLNDLLSIGTLALDDLTRTPDAALLDEFPAYARFRIRGAMLDAVGVEAFHERVRKSADVAKESYGAQYRDDDYDVSKHDKDEARRRYRAFASGLLAATFMAGVEEATRATDHDERAEQQEFELALRVLVPALARLADQERDLLVLVYRDKLTLTEAHERLGVPYIWARRHHPKALAQLREALIAEGVDRAPRPALLHDVGDVLAARAPPPAPGNDRMAGSTTTGRAKPTPE